VCRVVSALTTVLGAGSVEAAGRAGAPSPLPRVRGEVAEGVVRVPTTSNPLQAVGGRVRVLSTAGSYLVARTGPSAFVALSAACSHEACLITDAEADSYVCPCHGSHFDVRGAVETGPAEVPLLEMTATFANDVLSIKV
jgi:Rieske Fe-S protein